METIKIDAGEKIVLKIRKHWIILLRDTIGTLVIGLLPFLIVPAVIATIPSLYLDAVGAAQIFAFSSAFWLLIIWMSVFVIWTNYYLDIWIVTDKRIFNIEQVNLFNRNVATWAMNRVQEISVKNENVLQTFFNYGSIEIQTAGPSDEYAKIEGIPNPDLVRTEILKQIGRADAPPAAVPEKVAPDT